MRVAISFTGGKDSVLATHLVLNDRLRAIAGWTGERDILEHVGGTNASSPPPPTPTPLDLRGVPVDVAALVTFAPPAGPEDKDDDDERGFKAHPLRLVRAQAAALSAGIAAAANADATTPALPTPFLILDITPPHADSYAAHLTYLREAHGVEALVTGDVLDVCSGFMAKACGRAGVRLITPLWQQKRPRILSAIHALGIRALITCVDVSKFPQDGPVDPIHELLGREITPAMWQQEQDGALSRASRALGVDLCGEGGEYHTAAFEAPHLFAPRSKLRVELKGHAVKGGRHAHVLLGLVGGGSGEGDEGEGTPGEARADEATRIG
jgi:diphthamide synthase (EF-2-diphthine--ammonia ligase)